MRPIPILTAILTVIVLFLLVFQREAINRFVGIEEDPVATEEVADAGPTAKAVSVIARPSKASDIESAVILRGETQAERQVTLLAETSGRVVDVAVAAGDMVENGQVLCTQDEGTRAVALTQAKAQLDEAKLNLTAAEKLAEGGFASDTQVLSARALFEAAEAGVEQAERALEDIKITAPFGGLVEGEPADVGTLLQPGSACATLVDLDPIRLVGYVSEAQVGRVSEGALAGARLTDGTQVQGEVTYLGRTADAVTRTFEVHIEVPNPDFAIRSGQSAEILIATQGFAAHLLPQSALTLNSDGALGMRVVGEGNVARFMPVELVRDSVDGVYVTGLPDQVNVIVVGQEYVKDGVAIDPVIEEPKL